MTIHDALPAPPPAAPVNTGYQPPFRSFTRLIGSSIFVFRRTQPDAERPYRAFGYPIVPIVFLLVAGWLLINTMMTAPTQSFIGIGLILLGLPVYYYLNSRSGSNTVGE